MAGIFLKNESKLLVSIQQIREKNTSLQNYQNVAEFDVQFQIISSPDELWLCLPHVLTELNNFRGLNQKTKIN
jgi:hypothetical protein